MPASRLKRLRANKKGPVNLSLFNLLENLLVFRTMEQLSVPQESSVKFRISRQEGEPGICLLIHIDEKFPLVEDGVPRPDYLAVYLHGNGCICTIIEMKSTAGKNLRHGLIQIKTLADRLKEEFREDLPPRFRLVIQGILLCQQNADVPNELIRQMAKDGLTILPAQFHHRAELYPYISQRNDLKTLFKSEARRPGNPSFIEGMMSQNTLNKRLPDELTRRRGSEGRGTGLHINFVLSDSDEYATLLTRGRKCVFVVSEQGDQYLRALTADIAANGLADKFDVEPMPVANP
jgi:hypothetical protein